MHYYDSLIKTFNWVLPLFLDRILYYFNCVHYLYVLKSEKEVWILDRWQYLNQLESNVVVLIIFEL